ncbi:HlyD family efflux transporter periplasmic adaptor subunit [Novosphingobium sp. FSY-8]|uniref:HlyD family efflux transporter periplasmic adaptor subunit n=1 Tax=Novosphingobium ovatum TaxID=1908523 RepID=A0ABW9XEK3_9SPHN|nr:HlyD family efflux transporter periplasmic adaptor subunit [Novosphingobium ovatum]NBC36972.1 HlyD family efflux transporter periplasmic adaptor subunit [Novosphingobium ovatum]
MSSTPQSKIALIHAEEAAAQEAAQDSARADKRKGLFLRFGLGVAVAALAYGGYDYFVASRHVETDNAYVGADVAQISAQISAPVQQVLVQDTATVRAGDVLIRLEDTDARLALARAQADLALTLRRVRGLSATDMGLGAQVAARAADQARADAALIAARADADRAAIDLKRREALAASGSVSGEELSSARNAAATAQANLRSAQAAVALAAANRDAAAGTREANRVLIDGTAPDTHPEVLAARAALEQARVNLERTVIRAPFDGVVTRRTAQVGQRAEPGKALMVVVPVQTAYVDANFKEVQLTKVRAGQKVTLTSDLYGSGVVYHGTVVGFSGGTGAAFAVVPAQNATGNWIKVVQRLPVRIALEPKELAAHPLRVGLSMTADIDIAR